MFYTYRYQLVIVAIVLIQQICMPMSALRKAPIKARTTRTNAIPASSYQQRAALRTQPEPEVTTRSRAARPSSLWNILYGYDKNSTIESMPSPTATQTTAQPTRTWGQWLKSFSLTSPNSPWKNWFSVKSLKEKYQPTLVKTFTLPESQATPEAFWQFIEDVLIQPFKYNDFVFKTQLLPFQKIINEPKGWYEIVFMNEAEMAGKTALDFLLGYSLSIELYRFYRGRKYAYRDFIQQYTNHADATIAYCNKIIEMGGNLGQQPKERLTKLLLDIEKLRFFFDKDELSINGKKLTIDQMVKPFEEVLRTVASKQNINFEKVQKEVHANAMNKLYWSQIEKWEHNIVKDSLESLIELLEFYPSLVNAKRPSDGKTVLDIIFDLLFHPQDINDLLTGSDFSKAKKGAVISGFYYQGMIMLTKARKTGAAKLGTVKK